MYRNIEEMCEYLNYDKLAHDENKMVISVFDKETEMYGVQQYTKGDNCIYPKKFISLGANKDLAIRYCKGSKK